MALRIFCANCGAPIDVSADPQSETAGDPGNELACSTCGHSTPLRDASTPPTSDTARLLDEDFDDRPTQRFQVENLDMSGRSPRPKVLDFQPDEQATLRFSRKGSPTQPDEAPAPAEIAIGSSSAPVEVSGRSSESQPLSPPPEAPDEEELDAGWGEEPEETTTVTRDVGEGPQASAPPGARGPSAAGAAVPSPLAPGYNAKDLRETHRQARATPSQGQIKSEPIAALAEEGAGEGEAKSQAADSVAEPGERAAPAEEAAGEGEAKSQALEATGALPEAQASREVKGEAPRLSVTVTQVESASELEAAPGAGAEARAASKDTGVHVMEVRAISEPPGPAGDPPSAAGAGSAPAPGVSGDDVQREVPTVNLSRPRSRDRQALAASAPRVDAARAERREPTGAEETVPSSREFAHVVRRGGRGAWVVLLLAGAMVAGWYAARSCNDAEESAAHQAAAMPSPEPASTIAHRPWVPRSTKLRAKEKAATDAAAQDKKPASAPFDPAKAHEALSGAVRAAGSCRMRGDPSGVVEVDIRFEPSGSVKSVRIQSGEFRNTETGRCIQRRIRDTKIPEFSGASSMVTRQITVY